MLQLVVSVGSDGCVARLFRLLRNDMLAKRKASIAKTTLLATAAVVILTNENEAALGKSSIHCLLYINMRYNIRSVYMFMGDRLIDWGGVELNVNQDSEHFLHFRMIFLQASIFQICFHFEVAPFLEDIEFRIQLKCRLCPLFGDNRLLYTTHFVIRTRPRFGKNRIIAELWVR